jgi:hypothetical protein
MNERIRELAEQASQYANEQNELHGVGYVITFKEKFAQLIVRECAELFVGQKYMVLNPHEPFANERVRALKEHDKDTVRKIKGHFGVEE